MREALEQGKKAREEGEVPVGCVVVDREGRVVGRGHNRTNALRDPTAHAELEAIRHLLTETQLQQPPQQQPFSSLLHSLYVTIEPCLMCAAALRRLPSSHRLARVVFGARNPRFGGCGTVEDILMRSPDPSLDAACHPDSHLAAPFLVHEGVLAEEAVNLLKDFYAEENTRWAPEEKRRKK